MNEHTHNPEITGPAEACAPVGSGSPLQPRDRAFADLVKKHQGLLFTIIYGITLDREETLDILQETFLKALGEPRLFDPEFNTRAWLVRVARNLALNFKRGLMRSLKRLLHIGSLASAEHAPDPVAALIREEDLQALRSLFQGVSPAERDLLTLRYLADMTVPEIAVELGVPQGTVMSRLSRLRQRLGDALEEQENDS